MQESILLPLVGVHLILLAAKQRLEQEANRAATINVIKDRPILAPSDEAFYFTAWTSDFNGLCRSQLWSARGTEWHPFASACITTSTPPLFSSITVI